MTWAACPPAPAAGSGSEQGLQKKVSLITGWSSVCCRKSDVTGVHEEMEDLHLGERGAPGSASMAAEDRHVRF